MGAPTAPAICTRSLRSRRPRRSSLNVEPASSWSTQEVASQPERSIEHLAYACRCPTTTQGPDRSAQAQGCIPQMWVIGSVCGAPCEAARAYRGLVGTFVAAVTEVGRGVRGRD